MFSDKVLSALSLNEYGDINFAELLKQKQTIINAQAEIIKELEKK